MSKRDYSWSPLTNANQDRGYSIECSAKAAPHFIRHLCHADPGNDLQASRAYRTDTALGYEIHFSPLHAPVSLPALVATQYTY
jgi:hypothetical protein